MANFSIAIILLLCLVGCEYQTKKDNTTQTKVFIDTSLIAVMATKYPPWVFKGAKPADLSMNDLEAIEIALTKCISVFNAQEEKRFALKDKQLPELGLNKATFVIDLPKYKRQYFPVINSQGEKEVWINCLCPYALEWPNRFESFKDWNWKKTYVRFNDGGNCFFYLKVNLATGKYYDFMTNGSETIDEENQ